MSLWRKYFADQTYKTGTDKAISAKQVSWSQGRLEDISSVLLTNNKNTLFVSAPNTNWHQFDRYVLNTTTGTSSRICRCIQFLVQNHHVGMTLYYNKRDSNRIELVTKSLLLEMPLFDITESNISSWITFVLSESTTRICISPRGKITWEPVNILIK